MFASQNSRVKPLHFSIFIVQFGYVIIKLKYKLLIQAEIISNPSYLNIVSLNTPQ